MPLFFHCFHETQTYTLILGSLSEKSMTSLNRVCVIKEIQMNSSIHIHIHVYLVK